LEATTNSGIGKTGGKPIFPHLSLEVTFPLAVWNKGKHNGTHFSTTVSTVMITHRGLFPAMLRIPVIDERAPEVGRFEKAEEAKCLRK